MNWRYRTERKLEDFSDFVFNNRKKIIVVILLLVVAVGTQLRHLTMDTSTEGFLHESDPMRLAYDEFRDQFGRDEKLLVAVKTKDVFDLDFLKKLEKLHKRLESELPYIEEVNSLINARNTYGDKDSLIVEDLFEVLPKAQADLALVQHWGMIIFNLVTKCKHVHPFTVSIKGYDCNTIKNTGGVSECGADGQSRTGTSVAHYPLKVARLPIPPHRQ